MIRKFYRKHWTLPHFTYKRSPYPHGAIGMIHRYCEAKHSLNQPVVQIAIPPHLKQATTASRRYRIKPFTPTLICYSTTWAKPSPIIARTTKPMVASGKRPHCGALDSQKLSAVFRPTYTMAEPEPCSKPLCSTAAKPNNRAKPCETYPKQTATHCSPFCNPCRTHLTGRRMDYE